MRLPSFKGSALRGAFGHALKRVACALRRASCADCLLRQSCVYLYVFETPPPPDSRRLRRYPTAPHPFILRPPEDRREVYESGEKLVGELLLVGKAVGYLPYFIYALQELGEAGLGRGRGKCSLEVVEELTGSGKVKATLYQPEPGELVTPAYLAWNETWLTPDQTEAQGRDVDLEIITPLRLKFQGHLVDALELHHLIRNLLRRLASLAYFHCGIDPENFDFRGAIHAAEKVPLTASELSWQEWERYSQRQREKMLMGGVVGRVSYARVPADLLSLLRVGEHLHVGKMASFGLGRYRIAAPKYLEKTS